MKVFMQGALEVDEADLSAVFGWFWPVKSLDNQDRETKESKVLDLWKC